MEQGAMPIYLFTMGKLGYICIKPSFLTYFFRFVYEDNEHDGYWIKLGLSKSDTLQEKRLEVLRKLSIAGSTDFLIKKGPRPIEGKLLAFLRVFNMNEGNSFLICRLLLRYIYLF